MTHIPREKSAIQNVHLFAELCCQDNYASVRTLNSCFFLSTVALYFQTSTLKMIWKLSLWTKKKSFDRIKSQAMGSTQALAQPVHHRWCNCWRWRQSCCNAVISAQVTPCWGTHSDWTHYSTLSCWFCSALRRYSLVTEQHSNQDHRNLYERWWQAGDTR